MPVQKSLTAYQQEKLNCAQSILRGFQNIKKVSDDTIVSAKALGGGRAPEGRCGALHAAMEIASTLQTKEALIHAFTEKAGSEKCQEIRKLKKLTCAGCIQLAAEELIKERDIS